LRTQKESLTKCFLFKFVNQGLKMKRTEFKIEYQLKTASLNVLWNSISTPLGLSEWFADGVTVNDSEFYFLLEKE